ncbi:MAG: hypothetical protein IRZ07_30805 [Microbispora sp.]|nr:hypothetical protein [Microbispora sp.]
MQYAWKPGFRVGGLDAQVVGERLDAIRERDGGIMAEAVVDDARPVDSPLHPAFEWDDSVAAEKYRLDQARYLIRAVVIQRPDVEEPRPVRAFVVVKESDGNEVYTSTITALSDEELRRQVLERALRELDAWRRRYDDLAELAEVLAAADRALETVGSGSVAAA